MKALQLTLDMSQRWLFGKRNFIRDHHYSGSI